jgi:hypothetical protein
MTLNPSHHAGVSRLPFSARLVKLNRTSRSTLSWRALSRTDFPQFPMLDLLSLTSGLPSGAIAWCLYECSQMFVELLLAIFFNC